MAVKNKTSIVVCTYEPEPKGFSRLLAALDRMADAPGWMVDVTIIDNNSPTPIEPRLDTQAFLAKHSSARVLVEKTPGLSAARRKGIESTDGAWILMFDDDNDPAPDYVARACQLAEEYPSVGAWGAGTVHVEFLEPLADPYVERRKDILHEVNRGHLEYACLRGGWHRCYPAGMGMMLRRDIAEEYLRRVDIGQLSAKDRVGRTLSAAGDVQIVFTGITMGFAAGLDPALKMQHMMGARKATFSYLKRVVYGNALSYAKAYQEAYQEPIAHLHLPTNGQIAREVGRRVYQAARKRVWRSFLIDLATYLGQIEGNYLAKSEATPPLLERLKRFLEL